MLYDKEDKFHFKLTLKAFSYQNGNFQHSLFILSKCDWTYENTLLYVLGCLSSCLFVCMCITPY
jgi:hypothetical protein